MVLSVNKWTEWDNNGFDFAKARHQQQLVFNNLNDLLLNHQLIFVLSGNNGGAAADTAQIEADIADLQTKVDTLEMTTVPDAITQITNVETSAAANCQKLLEVTAELPAVADPVC